jgi:dihydroorotate dehydrogenase (fumarate)
MDLRTKYLGLELAHPLMPGASPMVDDIDLVCRLEDAGASAIVMHSLYEEQLAAEQAAVARSIDGAENVSAEALSYFPRPWEYQLGPEEYLTQLQRIKERVRIPVIGSLNGQTLSGWLDYAAYIEQAGADAIELNIFHVPTDPEDDCDCQSKNLLEIVREVRRKIRIPLAVKLSPFYCSLPALARRLKEAGADGLVLFNRPFQADLDLENLDVVRQLALSDSSELPLRLRWLAILEASGLSLGASGGVHTAEDALKAVMCGANAVQLVSVLLRSGPTRLRELLEAMSEWLENHEYSSLSEACGSLSLRRCPDPGAFLRGNYVHMLQTWQLSGADRPGVDRSGS